MGLFQNELDGARLELDERIKRDLKYQIRKSGLKIAVAEALTGGRLSNDLSQITGGTDQFLGGVVCPHPITMVSFLGTPAKLIRESGSEDQVKDMLHNLKKRCQAHICIVTASDRQLGLSPSSMQKTVRVTIGFDLNGEEKIKTQTITGTDTVIISTASQMALMVLKQWFSARVG